MVEFCGERGDPVYADCKVSESLRKLYLPDNHLTSQKMHFRFPVRNLRCATICKKSGCWEL